MKFIQGGTMRPGEESEFELIPERDRLRKVLQKSKFALELVLLNPLSTPSEIEAAEKEFHTSLIGPVADYRGFVKNLTERQGELGQ